MVLGKFFSFLFPRKVSTVVAQGRLKLRAKGWRGKVAATLSEGDFSFPFPLPPKRICSGSSVSTRKGRFVVAKHRHVFVTINNSERTALRLEKDRILDG
ncbi:hypothetical protein [Acetobacter nitrogenifigens]|uniref:hypothetical protein n=1 Tax=Acetobacter nitrogenifigens TaxID=285268 RepID=UPI000408E051|nr:hypothetical protein [Acetobacter nitrogenifigens]